MSDTNEKLTIEKIANASGVSKTTVIRVLNHCPGVDINTKEIILGAAAEYKYTLKNSDAQVVSILPGQPKHSFREMYQQIRTFLTKKNISHVFYTYSAEDSEGDTLRCLDTAQKLEANVVCILAPDSQAVRDRLLAMSERTLILLIDARYDLKNTFFIGTDFSGDGYRLGRRYLEHYPQRRNFLIVEPESAGREQTEGFIRALHEAGITNVPRVQVPDSSRAQAANIARKLAEYRDRTDCVFYARGNISDACSAVRKINADRQIHCIGFGSPESSKKYWEGGILKMLMCRNFGAVAQRIAEAADHYLHDDLFPKQKYLYTEGILLEAEEEA